MILVVLLASTHAHADPDFAHAKDLYRAAEAAMLGGRYVEALVDYGSAYDITKDPVLFYKLGSANERAGNCDVAIGFYRRYLAEAHPDANYIALTRDRITACGGDTKVAPPPPDVPAPPPTPPPPPAPVAQGHGTWPGWLLVGGTLGLVTIGTVLAYATTSSENDVKDLYAGADGQPPPFNAATQQRYQQLLDQGHRYEVLAWTAFGTAALTATAATIVFLTTHQERIAPLVAPQAAGVSLSGRF